MAVSRIAAQQFCCSINPPLADENQPFWVLRDKKEEEENLIMDKIWCVEDEKSIRDILLYTLKSCGFEARGFSDGAEFEHSLQKEHPDLILMDIMLPVRDGMSLLQSLRSNPDTCSIPVIMTTAKGQEYDKIEALEAGADDYLVKPFGMMEMMARIRAVLRRTRKQVPEATLQAGDLRMDVGSHRVFLREEPLELTRKEFGMLRLFMEHPDQVFSRDQLFEKIWDTDFAGESRTVDVHIGSLRTKLKDMSSLIETVRGIGYRMKKNV